MYNILRKILFCIPPEEAHHFSMSGLSLASKIPGVKNIFRSSITADPRLEKELFGLKFTNPVGLAAGFDKNALYLDGAISKFYLPGTKFAEAKEFGVLISVTENSWHAKQLQP